MEKNSLRVTKTVVPNSGTNGKNSGTKVQKSVTNNEESEIDEPDNETEDWDGEVFDKEFHKRLETPVDIVDGFEYNENGVCLNPVIVLSHHAKGKIGYEIEIARNSKGWSNGYSWRAGTAGGFSGVWLNDEGFPTREEAVLERAEWILKTIQGKISAEPELKKQAGRLAPLQNLIGETKKQIRDQNKLTPLTLLRAYKGHEIHGTSTHSKGTGDIWIRDDQGELFSVVNYFIKDPNSLNRGIKRAKEWIDEKFPDQSQSKNNDMSQPQLQMVRLTDITASGTNSLQREDWELQEPALKELADSISQKGVISPVLLRPNGKAGKFFLVCGERRYLASKIAGKSEIPAFIKQLTDEEAFDLQITENLQRKDVHPMKEAQAYKALMDANPEKNTVTELALRFGKSESYITQRLAFNNLLPEMKKDFFGGKMLIGHAQLFSRLQEADQKEATKECKLHKMRGGDGEYRPIEEVKEWIEDEIMHVLGDAPFDKKDPSLIPKAGACVNCPKQSGGNLLFADLKEKDRCFDGKCYASKKLAHTLKQINELVLTEPAMPVVKGWSHEKTDPAIERVIKENKIRVLARSQDYDEASKKDKSSTMALMIAGHDAGRIVGIKFKSTEKAKTAKAASAESDNEALTAETIDAQIAGIKERTKRSAELDADKVHKQITDRLRDIKPYREPYTGALDPAEYDALVYLAYENAGYDIQDFIKKAAKIKGLSYRDEQVRIAEYLTTAPQETRNFIIRSAIRQKFIGLNVLPSLKSPGAWLVRRIAETYPAIDIKTFETEQKVVRDKREASAAKRIADLQKKKKELLAARPKPKKK